MILLQKYVGNVPQIGASIIFTAFRVQVEKRANRMGEVFANHMSDKGLVSRVYKELCNKILNR